MAIPILGAPPETGFIQLTAQLAEHMQRKHPAEVQQIVAGQLQASLAYSAQVILAHFDSTDQGFMEWRDRARHLLFREMMRGPVSDERVETKVHEVCDLWRSGELDEAGHPIDYYIIQLVKSMRDAIEERDLYPEPTQSLVSVV